MDERSAAFTALGMAVALKQTVAIVCTSGTAVLNLYPAVCEAYYSQIPLLILTADRPPHLIDNWDGQCIRQTNIFEKHILGSFTFDPLKPDQDINNELRLCTFPVMGPVHINIPLEEPLYEGKNDLFEFDEVKPLPLHGSFAPNHVPGDLNHKKVLLLAGADDFGSRFSSVLEDLSKLGKVVVLADVISGLHGSQNIDNWDAICQLANEKLKEELKPDLLITMGKFTVSKSFKNFIRQNKPIEHWHVTPNHTIADPFQTNPQEVECHENIFLEWLTRACSETDNSYYRSWNNISMKVEASLKTLFNESSFNEFTAVNTLLEQIPPNSFLHSGNSMPVRYLSYLSGKLKGVSVYANRGTSGIDGSISTAAGTSMVSEDPVFILTGDLSFFYDINGLWNQYLKPNFKIIVLNNGGGGIFRLIDGPHDLPEREKYFATASERNCARMAEEFGFKYSSANDFVSLKKEMEGMCRNNSKPCILEIFTEQDKTISFYKAFKELKIDI